MGDRRCCGRRSLSFPSPPLHLAYAARRHPTPVRRPCPGACRRQSRSRHHPVRLGFDGGGEGNDHIAAVIADRDVGSEPNRRAVRMAGDCPPRRLELSSGSQRRRGPAYAGGRVADSVRHQSARLMPAPERPPHPPPPGSSTTLPRSPPRRSCHLPRPPLQRRPFGEGCPILVEAAACASRTERLRGRMDFRRAPGDRLSPPRSPRSRRS